MLSLFVSAFLIGLVFNAAPGAILAETIRQGLSGGFKPALAVQLGSLAGDAAWAIIGLAGIGFLFQIDALRVPIGLAGALYLMWLAGDAWRSAADAGAPLAEAGGPARARRSPMKTGALMSLTNPQNVVYWAALGSAMGAVGIAEPGLVHYLVFFTAFMTSSVLWCFFCAAIVERVFGRANARWSRISYRMCAIALFALALASMLGLASPA